MKKFQGFTPTDFDVFNIEGLENRMEALRSQISPKLESIATELAPDLTAMTGDEMFVHVARHARRKTNPPNDTWAALASNKRGYKKLPHFQVGLWESHVFIWFAVIYESPIKEDFGRKLEYKADEVISSIPQDYVWSIDHTKPDVIPHKEVDKEKLMQMTDRLQSVKKAEILCGRTINKDDSRLQEAETFLTLCKETFEQLEPLYRYTKQLDYSHTS